jgi:hypothetical protein
MNDMWVFNIEQGEWRWVSGLSTPNNLGIYNSTDASTIAPGGRSFGASFSDSNGNLWIFGGGGFTLLEDSAGTFDNTIIHLNLFSIIPTFLYSISRVFE